MDLIVAWSHVCIHDENWRRSSACVCKNGQSHDIALKSWKFGQNHVPQCLQSQWVSKTEKDICPLKQTGIRIKIFSLKLRF
jgi:hypothetical protein